MIKLAKHAEANAKAQPKKAGKSSIEFSQKWLYAIFVVLLGFQVYLNIAAYYAVVDGMKNFSLFLLGIMMLVFAGMFHLYRYGKAKAKAPPPKPTPPAAKPAQAPPKPAPAAPATEKPLTAPPASAPAIKPAEQPARLPPQKSAATSPAGAKTAATTTGDNPDIKGPKTS